MLSWIVQTALQLLSGCIGITGHQQCVAHSHDADDYDTSFSHVITIDNSRLLTPDLLERGLYSPATTKTSSSPEDPSKLNPYT